MYILRTGTFHPLHLRFATARNEQVPIYTMLALMVLIWNLPGPVEKATRPLKRLLQEVEGTKKTTPHQPAEVGLLMSQVPHL